MHTHTRTLRRATSSEVVVVGDTRRANGLRVEGMKRGRVYTFGSRGYRRTEEMGRGAEGGGRFNRTSGATTAAR